MPDGIGLLKRRMQISNKEYRTPNTEVASFAGRTTRVFEMETNAWCGVVCYWALGSPQSTEMQNAGRVLVMG
jgi:hypothetical protein